MSVRSLQMKSRKRLARDVLHSFASHSSPVHDVTNIDCWAQNGSTHGRVFETYKRGFLTNRTRNVVKNGCVSFLFKSIPIDKDVMLLLFSSPLNEHAARAP